jgi:hypothetical protein
MYVTKYNGGLLKDNVRKRLREDYNDNGLCLSNYKSDVENDLRELRVNSWR